MSLNIIPAHPIVERDFVDPPFLKVSEFFCDSIQGENFVGYPSAFLRLQGCTLCCTWCDSTSVWRRGNPYSFQELFDLMERADLIRKFKDGQHLVLTGGSPLLQQEALIGFLCRFRYKYGFRPFTEIENECTIMPIPKMKLFVDLWNNSPKLASSGYKKSFRVCPEILQSLRDLKNSWFKFVICDEDDWFQIEDDFLPYIHKHQIVLMPEANDRKSLEVNREMVVNLAIKHNVRYTSREHIELWNKTVGV